MQNEHDQHVSAPVSALVMLAAIGMAVSTYGVYQDTVVADRQEQAAASMDQAANVLMSYRLGRSARVLDINNKAAASSTKAKTASTTPKK